MGRLIVACIPFIIPAILIASWLSNTRTKSGGEGGEGKAKPKKTGKFGEGGGGQALPKPSESSKLSDKDMTG